MTKKEKLLLDLEIIKNEHQRWVTYAEAKFKGVNVEKDLIPVKHTECACGKMILEYGQVIYHLKSAYSLAKDHEEFHKIGAELYDFMHNQEKGNFFTKKIAERKNRDTLNNYAEVLKKMSDNLIKTFENIKNEINLIDDKKIESMLSNPE